MTSKLVDSFLQGGCRVTWVGTDLSAFHDRYRHSGVDYRLVPPARGRLGRLALRWRLRGSLRDLRDVDWFYAPTPDACEIAVNVARRQGGRVLYDLLEAYHRGLLDRYVGGREARALRSYVQRRVTRVCAEADLVSYVSEPVRRHYDSPDADFVLVRSCAPRWFAEGAPTSTPPAADGLRVLHGKLSAINGTAPLFAALRLLPDSVACRVVIVVDPDAPTDTSMMSEVRDLEEKGRLEVLAPVAHALMPAVMRTCQLGLIAYPRSLGAESLPNRLFEYMACGVAVAAPSYSPEILRILTEEDIGRGFDAEDPVAIAAMLTWASENLPELIEAGDRARRAFLARHNWDAEFERLTRAMTRP
ncbi:glycosyltransferase [Nocardioides sp. cx-173]|uniref:glycosyltransferase family protein n=1 Tax=Nocardioides sp. cx-173 TaxID=2898796 RepID=UPI001E57CBAA|nr:glycosyltransferase [Nocardioides sp. cx-173]UGB41909.1 glycosyltransferase [Nocardioides sp. cx-173]